MNYLAFILLGLGAGAFYAALGLGTVLTYRTSGVLNFAVGAVAIYGAYVYAGLRRGYYFNPIFGFEAKLSVGGEWGLWTSLALSLATVAVLGALLYGVFVPLRHSSTAARLVASVGVTLALPSLIGLRLGTDAIVVPKMLPQGSFRVGTTGVPYDRLILLAIIVVVALGLVAVSRFTMFGLNSRMVADSDRGAALMGRSAHAIACLNWMISAVVVGLFGIFLSPIIPLSPSGYTFLVVPGFAAALAGRLVAVTPCVITGFALGAVQSSITFVQAKTWFPEILRGLSDVVPFLVIAGILVIGGAALPTRSAGAQDRLPHAGTPQRPFLQTAVWSSVALLALVATDGLYRAALITSLLAALLCLSYVVITGYLGQVSFATLATAGIAAFSLTQITASSGLPFPIADVITIAMATSIGVLIGLPALRVRGVQLSVITLAAAVAINTLYFNNPAANGRGAGARIGGPRIFGMDLGILGDGYPRLAFGILCLASLAAVTLAVALLRRHRLGSYMLAIRNNERAAAAAGINVAQTKIIGFAISSAIASVAGVLLAYQSTIVTAERFQIFVGVAVFASLYLTGIATISGAMVAGLVAPGGLVITMVQQSFDITRWIELVGGISLILVPILHPNGMCGDVASHIERWRGSRQRGLAASSREDAFVAPTTATLAHVGDDVR